MQQRKRYSSVCRATGVALLGVASSWLAGCSGSSSEPVAVVPAADDGTSDEPADTGSSVDGANGSGGDGTPDRTIVCELAPGIATGHVPVAVRTVVPDGTRIPAPTFTYDTETNRFSRETIDAASGERVSFTEYAYDDAGRLTGQVEHADGDFLRTVAYEYEADRLVRRSATTEVGTFERTLSYDDGGRLVAATRETAGRTRYKRYEYGPNGFLASASEGLDPTIDEVEFFTEYTTDELGRIVGMSFGGSGDIANEFDDDGNLVRVSDYGSDGALLFDTRFEYERIDECVPNPYLHALRFDP